MEREREREPDVTLDSSYEQTVRDREKWIDRQRKGKVLIRGDEQKYDETRQGHIKYYLNPYMDGLALDSWSCFIHDIRRQSGRHRHQGGILIYVIEGEGLTDVEGEILSWQAGDLLLLPIRPHGVAHQHINKDESKKARWIAFRHSAVRDYIANFIEQLDEKPDSSLSLETARRTLLSKGNIYKDWKRKVDGDQVPLVTHPDELQEVNLFDKLMQLRDISRNRQAKATWLVRGAELPWEWNAHGRMQWYLHPCIAYSVVQTNLFYRQEIPVGSRSGVQRHGGDAVFFVLQGEGYTEIDGVRHNWRAEDVITLPIRPDGVIYRHVNTGAEPVLLIGVEPNMVHEVGLDRHSGFEELQPCPEYRRQSSGKI